MPAPTKSAQHPPLQQQQMQLEQLITQIKMTIPQLKENSSRLTALIDWWHARSFWAKGLVMAAVTIPLLLGYLTNIPLLSIFGINCILSFYTGIYLIQNHQTRAQKPELIEELLTGWIHLLASVMDGVTQCTKKLTEEINKLHTENQAITKANQAYQEEIKKLQQTNDALVSAQRELLELHDHLTTTLSATDDTLTTQRLKLMQSQELLSKTISAYQINQQSLHHTLEELTATKDKLAKKMEQAQQITDGLKKTILELASLSLAKEANKESLMKRLEDFIARQEGQFVLLFKEFSNSAQQLATTTAEINFNNERINALITSQEKDRMGKDTLSPAAHTMQRPFFLYSKPQATATSALSDASARLA